MSHIFLKTEDISRKIHRRNLLLCSSHQGLQVHCPSYCEDLFYRLIDGKSIMREIPTEKLAIYCVSVLLVGLLVPLLARLPRKRGKNPIYHVAYAAAVIVTIIFLPGFIQDEIFSPGGVVVIGTLLPIYSSILAVCTPGEADDIVWLQYWIASGTLSYCTEFIDEIREYFPNGGEHW
jgi:hypothetical protein